MALSNWDTYSATVNGPTGGRFVSEMGVRVEIYKNWLYVSDQISWRKGQFAEPTVMEIQHGDLQYLDVSINAVRGPQDGVYAVIRQGNPFSIKPTKMMVACGVYGYLEQDEPEWVGVQPESVTFLRNHLRAVADRAGADWDLLDDMHWAADSSLRFNQGDAFFAAQVGADVPATKPGEADEPLLTQMYKDNGDG